MVGGRVEGGWWGDRKRGGGWGIGRGRWWAEQEEAAGGKNRERKVVGGRGIRDEGERETGRSGKREKGKGPPTVQYLHHLPLKISSSFPLLPSSLPSKLSYLSF